MSTNGSQATAPTREGEEDRQSPSTRSGGLREPARDPPGQHGSEGRGLDALEIAKRNSPLGSLTDQELRNLVGLLVNLERSGQEVLDSYLAQHGCVGSLQHADYEFDVIGARTKAEALLSGDYLLLPMDARLPPAIVRDPNLHLVVGPGGVRDGIPFQTHIAIDLRKHGRFAEAKRVLEDAHRRRH